MSLHSTSGPSGGGREHSAQSARRRIGEPATPGRRRTRAGTPGALRCMACDCWALTKKKLKRKTMLIVFALDTSASTAALSTAGLSVLDCAKGAIEHFVKASV